MTSLLKQTKFQNLVIGGLLLLIIIPVFILAIFNHPSVADDYCFAYVTRDYGFWKGQKFYYDGWSGRYWTNFLFHATPLAFGCFWFVKVMPFIIVTLLFHATYVVAGEFFFLKKISEKLVVTASFLILFLGCIPSVVDIYYWYTSVFIYPIAIVYWLYLIVVINRFYQEKYKKIQIWVAILAGVLVFFIIGSNEIMMIFLVGLLGLTGLYKLIFHRKIDFFIAFLLIVAAFSSYLVISAPGNAVRMTGGNVLGGGIKIALEKGVKSFFKESFHWIFFTPILPFSIIFIAFLTNFKEKLKGSIYQVNRIAAFGAFSLLITLMLFGIHYGNDMGIPARVLNVIFGFFIIGWFYNLTLWVVQTVLSDKVKINTLITLISGVWIIINLILSPALEMMYSDILKGTAFRYDQEMVKRYALIQGSKKDTIAVTPLQNKPESLYFDEIKNNEKHLWNKCYAEYFQKKVIILNDKE